MVVGATLGLVVGSVPALAARAKPTDNGEAAKSATAILADAEQATSQVSSLRLAGTVVSSKQKVSLDVVSAHGSGGGKISTNGATFQIILVPPAIYMKADAATWTKVAGSKAAGQLFAGKWLQTTTANEDFASFSSLFDVSAMMQSTSTEGPLTKGPVASYRGTKAIPLKSETKGSVAYVAATGQPYVLGMVGTGAKRGEIVLSEFGTAKVPKAPSHSIDLSQLEQQAGSGSNGGR
jgi:hypothetical protein